MQNTIEYHLSKFNREDLENKKSYAVEELIIRLWNRTGDAWVPGNCRAIPNLTCHANEVHERSPSIEYFKKLVSKRYSNDHFFWLLESYIGENVILDPTGVPVNFQHLETIEPYYGLLEKSTGSHNIIYRNMKDIDDWGTREFPPGFHP